MNKKSHYRYREMLKIAIFAENEKYVPPEVILVQYVSMQVEWGPVFSLVA